jgi:lysophospholipase L1-like esterase
MIKTETIKEYSNLSVKKDRVVIIGDSLSMPRPDESLFYEETYPYLLKQDLGNSFEVINRGKRANTIKHQSEDQNIFDDIIFFYPKYVVIQLGIVDCAPRLFSRRFGKYVIGNIKPEMLKKFIIQQFSNRRLFFTKHFPRQYVPFSEFMYWYDYLLKIVKEFGSIPITVNIAQTTIENNKRSYGFSQHINKYNRAIEELSSQYSALLIDAYKISETNNILLPDGIHLNKFGSKIVALKIAEAIKQSPHSQT